MADWPSEASEVTLAPWLVTGAGGSCPWLLSEPCPGHSSSAEVRVSTRRPAAAPGHEERRDPLSAPPSRALSQCPCQPKAEPTFHTPALPGQGGSSQRPAEAELPCIHSIPLHLQTGLGPPGRGHGTRRAPALREHSLPLLFLNRFCFPRTGFSIFCLMKGICQQM